MRKLTPLTATKPLNSLVSCRVSRIVSSAMPRRRAHGAPLPSPASGRRLWATPNRLAMPFPCDRADQRLPRQRQGSGLELGAIPAGDAARERPESHG
jgi:hypothetical protein